MSENIVKKGYQAVALDIRERIAGGEFSDGDRLPTVRELAREYETTTVTVSNALKELDREGLVERKAGSGVFVKHVDNINFPLNDLRRIFMDILDNDGSEAFEYESSDGFSGLKGVVKERSGLDFKDREVLITSGSQQGLHLIFDSMLKYGDWVLVEEPTYPAALRLLNEIGARIETVPMTNDGPDLRELKRVFRSRPLRMAYLMPRYHNPTGVCYHEKTLKLIAELASENGVYVVEDNSFGELEFDNIKRKSLSQMVDSSRHFLLSSFSKTFLSGARIGYCLSPSERFDRLLKTKLDVDISSSGFFQRVLTRYIKSGNYDSRLEKLSFEAQKNYTDAFTRLINLFKTDDVKIMKGSGGYSFWIEMMNESEGPQLLNKIRENSFFVDPGAKFCLNPSENKYCVRYK